MASAGAEPQRPEAQPWNSTSIDFAEITMDRNFALLVVSLVSAVLWLVYITYYNSRVLGYLLTRLINKFYFQDDNFKIGSFTLNALSGKIMFRDIVYINYDYTLRIQDGYLIFRWWRSYIPKDVSEDLSHSDTRLSIMLNGFELHFYNRCDLYHEMEKTFGLEPVIKQQNEEEFTDRDKAMNDANEKRRRAQEAVRSEAAMARTWRDLIPVIKADVCSGRVVFGNRLVPTTLSIAVEEAHLVYSTKPPASRLDHLMHFLKAKAENCKVILAPSPNYIAMVDEPPRYMGEGFVVMSSNYIEVYFYMDEPGLVPDQPVLLQLANGDIVESAPPIWGVDIKCGKGTDFSYGPWADRQRDNLFKFFFPPNYKNLEVTPQPKPGDRRQMQSFDIRLSTLNEATIDILFTKNKETNAVHINIGAGSYLEVTLPWIVLQDGYTTKITGQLLHLEATTSLQYRSLAESETLEYTVKCHYPLVWNHDQCWQLALTGCKATAHLVYTHIDFIQDLINDWSNKSRPDILHFVPYTWKISLVLKECEVVTVSNQYNWIDCSSTNQENNHVAFCGDLLDVSFDLPFVDFLPDLIPLKIWIQGEAVDMSLYLPEVNTSRLLLLSIDKNMKLASSRLKASKWRRKCVKSQGWLDCWSVPIVALSVRYDYHPIPPLGPEPQADITTPEKEEILLSPMRIPRMRKQPQMNWSMDGNKFDRASLIPDKVSVELEVGPSILLAYGTIITSFMNLLENIFGEDQTFTDMQKMPSMENHYWSSENSRNDKSGVHQHTEISMEDSTDSSKGAADPRRCRPLDVTVSIILHDIQAHLVKNCSENEPPCPVVLIERFGFEMDKSFRETKLQLLLSPSILVSSNNLSRSNPNNSGPLYQGHLMLSSFQLRGHGLFSDANRSVEEDTIEYAWMMELQLGQLTGRLTLPQLYQVASSLETFLLLICDSENELSPPNPTKQCHHGVHNVLCVESDATLKYRCPTPNEIKYRMVRVAIDLIDVYVADSNTTLQTWISPIRLSFCNLHGPGFGTGVTGLLPNIKLALYTQTNMQTNTHHHSSGSNNSQSKASESDNWVGVGSVSLGPLLIEAASSLPQSPKNLHLVQQKFLRIHDEKTKRLWFMWPNEEKSSHCGCLGGCTFFGSNRNGANFLKPNPSDLQEGINIAMFNVIESTAGEYGYGQSLLHAGQLVFHTPPYSSLNVCLQPTAAPAPSPLPPPPGKSPQGAERRSLTRRFSYTSMGKGSSNVLVSSTKSDVPYARLVDSSVPLGNSKIDSDSKLNKTILTVPQMESSVSDSKLALSCGVKDNSNVTARKQPQVESDVFVVPKVPSRSVGVGVSESHYSLNSQAPVEDIVPPEVQRTMSITSENHSEAFFSADEDMFPSRSSSLKHSFGSRHSNPKDKSSFGINDITNEKWTHSMPRSEAIDGPDTISNLSTGAQPDSESGSVSSTSFISAISSQEDMTLVNLHMQTNKPIVDSPLLMSSYMQNLPQYRCSNWSACSLPSGSDVFTLPLFKRADDGTLLYVGQKYLPHFESFGKVNILKLISKKDNPNGQNQHGPYSNLTPHFNSQIKAHPYPQGWWDVQQNVQDNQENSTDKSSAPAASTTSDSRSGLFVKLRGEVDIMLTPLVLESTQKFVESLTPVLASVHPITVISHLRLLCISSVQTANILKQKQYVQNWLPQMQARNRSNPVMAKDDKCKLATIPHTNVYEETICEQLQATLTVPKVNMVFLQSSVVEDMISFSALDNIQDLTCVSLFGVSVENIIAKYVSSKRTLESVQLYYRPTLRALGSKKSFGIMKGPRALISQGSGRKRGPERGEPVFIETSQQQCEDTNITLNVGKVHGQLRRVRNDSCQLKDATITGIPCQHSKVSFKFIRADPCIKGCDTTTCCQGGTGEGQKDNAIGYIMFECGLEGVAIKVSQHAAAHKPSDEPRAEPDSGRESMRSGDGTRPDKENRYSKGNRTSGIEDLFRKRESGSKPSTPNLGASQAPPVPPDPAPAPPPPDEPAPEPREPASKVAGNTSSCAIDLKVVWFNFAAPPRTPITGKIDFTRLDWNLLSTASPAINAWMNPCNRLGIRVVGLYRAQARRLAATAASLMAAALELPPGGGGGGGARSRYGRHTPMARQLREEPSLQLCAALLRYALQADAAAVQADLAERHLPSLNTLRQGVIVLSRQWKNILYTPLLLEHNYKSKVMKPLNVTFALPDLLEESGEAWRECAAEGEGEALDENCLLLDVDVDVDVDDVHLDEPHPLPHPPGTAGGSNGGGCGPLFPALPFPHARRLAHNDAVPQYGSLAEEAGGGEGGGVGGGGEDSSGSLGSPHGSDENVRVRSRAREDLYQWMAKQDPVKETKTNKRMIPASKMAPQVTSLPACSLYPLQGSLMLLDAHLVFQPFLTALGVSPNQVPQGESKSKAIGEGGGAAPALESLGSKLSLLAWVDTFRIDIVVSDLLGARDHKHHKGKAQPSAAAGGGGGAETAAFLCEKVSLDVDVQRVADVAVEDLVRRRNVLYISRGQLKKHISTVLNFNIAVRFISQQVNMPLLRLLHQISNMYQNVKDTQCELRTQTKISHSHSQSQSHRHNKHSSSSVSDFRENLVSLSSLDKEPLEAKWSAPPTPQPEAAPPAGPGAVPPQRRRPQSFAQKLRSTGKSVKGKLGYSSLNEGAHTPMFIAEVPLRTTSTAGPAAPGGPGGPAGDKLAPRCWRTVYLLLDLYANMPDAETITHRFSVSTEMGRAGAGAGVGRPGSREQNASSGSSGGAPGVVVVGVARIHRTRLLASLSGLKLEAELTSLQGSLSATRARQWSLSGTLGRSMIVLLEGKAPTHQTVVRVSVGKSQALYSWEGGRGDAAALGSVGPVRVELPQHPVALHGVMTRSSRQLSDTLQELGVTRSASRLTRAPDAPPQESPVAPRARAPTVSDPLLHPLHLQFSIAVQSVSITAALLPSLQAQYRMEHVHSSGVTGHKAHFTVELPQHSLSFVTRLQAEANIPAAASVALPAVHVAARALDERAGAPGAGGGPPGAVLRAGRYLAATADIGLFEHTLSTDLLNHLVFVQKVFMKEVNEVVQKVYGGEKPVPLWNEEEAASSALSRILFSLTIRIKRIQLTATTPSNSAVRLETGAVELELSNRVQNVPAPAHAPPHDVRLFARAQVDLNLSLGQLIRNAMFEEAEPEFQQYAFFNTRIAMRNAFQEEMVCGSDKEVVLITLKRPLVYIQPVAVDKAILVWLNYKNAYEYWNEKRLSLNTEVLAATQQLFEKVQLTSQMTAPHLSTLFLQLNVDDIGICVPLNQPPMAAWGGRGGGCESGCGGGGEAGGAVVVTLESTSVSACSSGALVSKGRFVGLCLRFAADFEASLDDWQPRADEPSLNVCCVSEGTYEVCSRTTAAKHHENAKWYLNVSWQMEGVDIHLDVSVGKQLSALGHTLTMLTGFEEEDPLKCDYESDLDDEADNSKDSQESIVVRRKCPDHLPAFVFDARLDARQRSKLIEKEMTEQAKIITDLRTLGASHSTIEYEMKRLHDLEALVFKDFRRDMIQKLRRQSVKASSITKGKLGLGSNRSRSFMAADAPPDRYRDRDRRDLDGVSEAGGSPEAGGGGGDSEETLLLGSEERRLADIMEGASWSSAESPAPASRSASLRARAPRPATTPPPVQRQSSLPAAPDLWPDPDPDPEPDHDYDPLLDEVQLRPKHITTQSSGEGVAEGKAGGSGSGKAKQPEPNIDLELDVKVHINSGKCVLHTKEPAPDTDIKLGARMRVGRSASGGLGESGSGSGGGGAPPSPGARRRGPPPARHHPAIDLTVFRVPGLDLKVHYESKTVPEEGASPQSAAAAGAPASAPSAPARKLNTKKAALFAWITLQSIPEETIISPHILEFLEQTLEPIPAKAFSAPTPEGMSRARSVEAGSYGQYVYASFPVDVIVHFHMQPSTFRFSCLPASRVECLLQLPSLQIVFSSKRATDEQQTSPGVAMGGLSVTGCLADFSVYMFHPYGGKKSSLKEAQWSPLSDSERKDSLSINVEFVKFHLSRSRKLDFHADHDQSKATVRFSTIVDVGSAWFKYDMRRLGEILAFPKAWYRRTIVRRMFLGDLSVQHQHQHQRPPDPPHTTNNTTREKTKTDPQKHKDNKESVAAPAAAAVAAAAAGGEGEGEGGAAWETLVLFAVNFTKLNVHMNMGNVMGNVSWQSRSFNCSGRLSIGSTGHRNMLLGVALAGSSLDARGGIVGGAICLADIHTYAHISEEPGCSPGHVCGVRLAALELRLEYMGTPVLLARVSCLRAAARDQWRALRHAAQAPQPRPAIILTHGTLSWQQLQILMSRSTTPDLLKMQLKLEEFFTQQFKSSKRVFNSLHPDYRGRRHWDNREPAAATAPSGEAPQELRHHRHWQKVLRLLAAMQLSTLSAPLPADGMVLGGTMELHGTNVSLACFHGNSFKAKSWALFSLKDPCVSFATEAQQVANDSGELSVNVVQSLTASLGACAGAAGAGGAGAGAHGHQSQATVCRMTRALLFPPQFKTLKEWFQYAFASSEIDAIEQFPSLEREGGGGGGNTNSTERDRERGAPGDRSSAGSERAAGGGERAHKGGGGGDKHVREVIFALPSLQLHLRTHHVQAPDPPTENDAKPVVECSFITEFEDHIFVSVDAEAFLFLHDLISSYIKEKARVMPSGGKATWGETSHAQGAGAGAGSGAGSGAGGGAAGGARARGEALAHDYRDYNCTTWHLEPTVRLLSWAGKSIEPYGVDYILQKLGFSHARTTIPKWLQRGALDPLDSLLALVLLRLLNILPHK